MNFWGKILFYSAILAMPFLLTADDQPVSGRKNGPRMGMGGNENPRTAVEAKLKEQYPAEYAEIIKLREQAETQLKALAKKAGVELPAAPKSRDEIMSELKAQYPAEYAEIEKLRNAGNWREAMEKTRSLAEKAGIQMPGPGRNNRSGRERDSREIEEKGASPRENPSRHLRAIREQYPQEWKKFQELRNSDPAEAQKLLRKLVKQLEEAQK